MEQQLNIIGDSQILSRGAVFSEDRKYRYILSRWWRDTGKRVMFIGLNPSKADENRDDNTVTRCINFAKAWGYSGMYMMNLFAYVSTDPKKLLISGEDIEINNEKLRVMAAKSDKVIFAWGTFKQAKLRMAEVVKMFPDGYCLKFCKNGEPSHPLYLKSDLVPIKYNNK